MYTMNHRRTTTPVGLRTVAVHSSRNRDYRTGQNQQLMELRLPLDALVADVANTDRNSQCHRWTPSESIPGTVRLQRLHLAVAAAVGALEWEYR